MGDVCNAGALACSWRGRAEHRSIRWVQGLHEWLQKLRETTARALCMGSRSACRAVDWREEANGLHESDADQQKKNTTLGP